MRHPHDPTPNARLRVAPVLWLIWAALCVGALIFAGGFLAQIVVVPQTQYFIGTIKPNQTPIAVQLPAGVPLKSLLVKSGETVAAGQTVALLDDAAMRAQVSQIERSIEVASVLRTCLLQLEADPAIADNAKLSRSPTETPKSVTDAEQRELDILIRAANAECTTVQRHDRDEREQLARAIQILQDRLALIDQKLAMILGVQANERRASVDPFLRAHASVSVAIERNDLIQKLQRLSMELGAIGAKQDRARLARVGALSQDVARKLTQQAVLRTYLENPRLVVPESGRVGRVRPVPAGKSFVGEETLIEVHGTQEAQYIADLRVPVTQIDQLPIGTDVVLSLAGFTESGPQLEGKIDRWTEGESQTGAHFAYARIALQEQSQIVLSDPANGIALRGQTTASAIRARMKPKSLQSTLSDAVLAHSEWVGLGFLWGGSAAQTSMQRPM